MKGFHQKEGGRRINHNTCFNEIGNVSLPHCSGVLIISFVMVLQDLQTEAQKTTTARAGHEVSLSSTLRMMSKSNSGGRFAHRPCWINSNGEGSWSGAMCDIVRFRQCLLPSSPRLEMLPIPSFISRSSLTKLLSDIFLQHKQARFLSKSSLPPTTLIKSNIQREKVERQRKLKWKKKLKNVCSHEQRLQLLN